MEEKSLRLLIIINYSLPHLVSRLASRGFVVSMGDLATWYLLAIFVTIFLDIESLKTGILMKALFNVRVRQERRFRGDVINSKHFT